MMLNLNQNQIVNSTISWEQTVSGLIDLYTIPKNFSIQQQITQNDHSLNPHYFHIYSENLQIVSLYHSRFNEQFSDLLQNQLKDAFTSIDYQSPLNYNLGRNESSSVVFSKNHQFVLKTITACNFNYFKKVFFKDYFTILEENKCTVIAKIYGVYSMEKMIKENDINETKESQITEKKPSNNTKVHFILMENLFFETFGSEIMMLFDLKGASKNRRTQNFKTQLQAQQECLMNNNMLIPTIKGKDNDFQELNDYNPFRSLSSKFKSQLMEAITQETSIMQQSKMMDYSLMLIVVRMKQNCSESSTWRKIHVQDDIYLTVGIIDYLQEYNQTKLLETKVKSFLRLFQKNKEISCVDSEKYRQRFLDYCLTMLADHN